MNICYNERFNVSDEKLLKCQSLLTVIVTTSHNKDTPCFMVMVYIHFFHLRAFSKYPKLPQKAIKNLSEKMFTETWKRTHD